MPRCHEGRSEPMPIGEAVAARREAFYTRLETGNLLQIREVLEAHAGGDRVGYCCLGVATRVAMEWGLPLVASDHYEGGYVEFARCSDSKLPPNPVLSVLHDDVVEWYRFPNDDPDIIPEKGSNGPRTATICNDTLQMSFPMIARCFRRAFPADPMSEV